MSEWVMRGGRGVEIDEWVIEGERDGRAMREGLPATVLTV